MVPVRGEASRGSTEATVPHEIASGFTSPRPTTPIHDAASAFEARFARLELAGRSGLVAAVSGGSDSTALLLLLHAALSRQPPETRLLAVTIDHGLRPDSDAEASAVARLCADHGIAHRTMSWIGPKPKTGLQAAAREARYRLLAEAATDLGTDIVFTGHTSDDQAETIAMRRRRGSGRGLAGMAPATLYDGRIWLLRPLLDATRSALRDYLGSIGMGWIDDPSNRNIAFERVRVRQDGPSEIEGASEAAEARRMLSHRAAALIAVHASLAAPGLVRLAPALFAADDREAAIHAFRALLAVTGGTDHLPDIGRCGALFDRVGMGPLCATLSRVVVDARRTGVFLRRELRGLPAPEPLHNGMIWDGRFRIRSSRVAGGMVIKALGPQKAGTDGSVINDVPKSLASKASAVGPSVRSAVSGALIADLSAASGGEEANFLTATPLLAPWARFLPSFDLALARSVAALVGAPDIPASPCEGHKKA